MIISKLKQIYETLEPNRALNLLESLDEIEALLPELFKETGLSVSRTLLINHLMKIHFMSENTATTPKERVFKMSGIQAKYALLSRVNGSLNFLTAGESLGFASVMESKMRGYNVEVKWGNLPPKWESKIKHFFGTYHRSAGDLETLLNTILGSKRTAKIFYTSGMNEQQGILLIYRGSAVISSMTFKSRSLSFVENIGAIVFAANYPSPCSPFDEEGVPSEIKE